MVKNDYSKLVENLSGTSRDIFNNDKDLVDRFCDLYGAKLAKIHYDLGDFGMYLSHQRKEVKGFEEMGVKVEGLIYEFDNAIGGFPRSGLENSLNEDESNIVRVDFKKGSGI